MNHNTWGKIILLSIPVLIFTFLYVAGQQHKQNKEMRRQTIEFKRDFNEMNAEMTGNSLYSQRAQARQAQLDAMKKAEAEKKAKAEAAARNLTKDERGEW